MNIIYFTSGISNKGGIERIVISKANYLGEVGHNVYICNLGSGEDIPAYPLHKNVKLISIKKNVATSIKQKIAEIPHIRQKVKKNTDRFST